MSAQQAAEREDEVKRIAVITGASSGMGKEFVNRIVKGGERYGEIWLIARRRERLEELQQKFCGQHFRLLALDLCDRNQLDRFRDILEEKQPRIRLFVHCAGFGVMGEIGQLPREVQADMVDINCRSVVELTSLLLPHMETGGRMIYMASASAFLPQPGFAVYAASKAFVLSFVRSLRAEQRAKDLKITAVCPGAVKTEFFDRALVYKDLPAYKKLVMADPRKVVRKALLDNRRNREISVYGLPIRLTRLLAKLLPHRLFLFFMGGRH